MGGCELLICHATRARGKDSGHQLPPGSPGRGEQDACSWGLEVEQGSLQQSRSVGPEAPEGKEL